MAVPDNIWYPNEAETDIYDDFNLKKSFGLRLMKI